MKLEHAQIITTLLANAGYLDDADELFSDMLDYNNKDEVLEFADNMDELITDINSVLPDEEKISTTRTMHQEVERQLDHLSEM